jgi:hypothetical protein
MDRYRLGSSYRAAAIAGLVGTMVVVAGSRWMRRWGVTDDDLLRSLAGDDIVANPRWTMTLATTIDARPHLVWPWLAQLGYRRGGLYSYDWLDRLFGILDRPSADRILPEFQGLKTGDVIPLGAGPDWPVALAEPNRTLVIAPSAPGFTVSWAFVLESAADGTTRLVTRSRADYATTPATSLYPLLLTPIAFAMTRKMLLGIKERAERLAGAGIAEASAHLKADREADEERDHLAKPLTYARPLASTSA